MEDAVLRGFAALGILTALACGATLGAVAWLVAWDRWQARKDLRHAKRLVAQNIIKPLGDCTCGGIGGTDLNCQVHGAHAAPLQEGKVKKGGQNTEPPRSPRPGPPRGQGRSIHRPLGDCSCACRYLNRDPTCQIHGSEEKP